MKPRAQKLKIQIIEDNADRVKGYISSLISMPGNESAAACSYKEMDRDLALWGSDIQLLIAGYSERTDELVAKIREVNPALLENNRAWIVAQHIDARVEGLLMQGFFHYVLPVDEKGSSGGKIDVSQQTVPSNAVDYAKFVKDVQDFLYGKR